MCTGIEIAVLASGALAAGSAIHQGQVQKNYADYQSDQAQADAEAAKGAAQVEAERIRKASKQQREQAVAALAGSGVNVDSGTALRIDQEISSNAGQDAYLTMVGGSDRAARLNADAQGFRLQGNNARTAGYVSAGTSLLAATTNNGRGWKKAAGAGA